MTATFDFDQLLGAVLRDDGPQAFDETVLEAALAEAYDTRQRRPLVKAVDRRAWPAPRLSLANPAGARLATISMVALLTLALLAALVFVGSLLPPPATAPGRLAPDRSAGDGARLTGRQLRDGADVRRPGAARRGCRPGSRLRRGVRPGEQRLRAHREPAGGHAWQRHRRRPARRPRAGLREGVVGHLRCGFPGVRCDDIDGRRSSPPDDDVAAGRPCPGDRGFGTGRWLDADLRRGLRPDHWVLVRGRVTERGPAAARRHAPRRWAGADHGRHEQRRLGMAAQDRRALRPRVGDVRAGERDDRRSGRPHGVPVAGWSRPGRGRRAR